MNTKHLYTCWVAWYILTATMSNVFIIEIRFYISWESYKTVMEIYKKRVKTSCVKCFVWKTQKGKGSREVAAPACQPEKHCPLDKVMTLKDPSIIMLPSGAVRFVKSRIPLCKNYRAREFFSGWTAQWKFTVVKE